MNSFLALNKQLCFAVYEVSSQMTKLYSSVLQPFQLTYPQYLVLLALWEEDGVTVKQLGDILGIGTGTLTPMLNRMEAQQWLRKERSKQDERRVHIYLEHKAYEQQQQISDAVISKVSSCHIDQQQYEQLLHQLHALKEKLQ